MGDADRRSEFFTADGAATDSHEIRASGDDVIYIATRIDAVNFHCRRSRTNKELTCTRIRALGQRRDKEIPKTPRPHLEQLEDSSLGAARDDRSTRVHGAAASIAELGRAARGERIRALFSALRAWPP